MSDDILFSMAWQCGDKDCKQQWHQSNYWIYGDGTYSCDSYGDGDHETVDEKELPTSKEVEESWREYAVYVAKHGIDPLAEYYVKHSTKKVERWRFSFNNSILGPVLIAAKLGKRRYTFRELPDHVSRYLNLDKGRRKLGDFSDWQSFETAIPGVKPLKWHSIEIEHDKPRPANAVSRELKRMARAKLKPSPVLID